MQTQILSAGGDGSIKLWDIANDKAPLVVSKGHQGEVFSCEWNHLNKQTILTGSFDHTIKLWAAADLQTGPK